MHSFASWDASPRCLMLCVCCTKWMDRHCCRDELTSLVKKKFNKERVLVNLYFGLKPFLPDNDTSTTSPLLWHNLKCHISSQRQKTKLFSNVHVFPNLDWCSLLCAPCTAQRQTQGCIYRCLLSPLRVTGWVPPQPLTKAMGGRSLGLSLCGPTKASTMPQVLPSCKRWLWTINLSWDFRDILTFT